MRCAGVTEHFLGLVHFFQGFTRVMQLQLRERQAQMRNTVVGIGREHRLEVAHGAH